MADGEEEEDGGEDADEHHKHDAQDEAGDQRKARLKALLDAVARGLGAGCDGLEPRQGEMHRGVSEMVH